MGFKTVEAFRGMNLLINKRKQDTRRKIQLRGLVIKAGMDQYPNNVILGSLIDAYSKRLTDKTYQAFTKQKGIHAFCAGEGPT